MCVLSPTEAMSTRSSLPWNLVLKSSRETWSLNKPNPYATDPRARKKRASVPPVVVQGTRDAPGR